MHPANRLLFPLRIAAAILDEQTWNTSNTTHRLLCEEIEAIGACKDVHRTVSVLMHQQGIENIIKKRKELESNGLLPNKNNNLPAWLSARGDTDRQRLFHMTLALGGDIHDALQHLQLCVFEQIRTETRLRCTCKAALHGVYNNSSWRCEAKVLIPTLTTTWDEIHGSRKPPILAAWNVPTLCKRIPRTMLVDSLHHLTRAAQEAAPGRNVWVNLNPLRADQALVIMDGFAIHIDLSQLTRIKNTRCNFV
jgi:hypothetical protein